MKLKSFLRALALAALGTGVIVLADHLGGWQPYERMSK